jgi:hypothetical protein
MRTLTLTLILIIALPSTSLAAWPNTVRIDMQLQDDTLAAEHPASVMLANSNFLVTFKEQAKGNVYQIVDLYGQKFFPENRPLSHFTDLSSLNQPYVTSDGRGGAYVAWLGSGFIGPGLYAQRIDSLGNLCWGDSGKLIINQIEFTPVVCSISSDGVGGLLITAGVASSTLSDIWVQRVSPQGQLLWGTGGTYACQYPYQQSMPEITHDGQGGAYVVWHDCRVQYEALYIQRMTPAGTPAWAANGIQVDNWEDPMNYDIISDGQGGCLVHGGYGEYNRVHRFQPFRLLVVQWRG